MNERNAWNLPMHAWQPLNEDERTYWATKFHQDFDFRPSMNAVDWPGISEPEPSITWDISAAFRSDDAYLADYEIDLNLKLLKAFCACTSADESLIAIDWHHYHMTFFPHAFFKAEKPQEWPAPILPNGDYSVFLQRDLDFGLFGHPWELSICVFGEELLAAIREDPPALFTRIIRSTK